MEEAEIKRVRALYDEGITEFRKRQRWLRLGFSDICRGRVSCHTGPSGEGRKWRQCLQLRYIWVRKSDSRPALSHMVVAGPGWLFLMGAGGGECLLFLFSCLIALARAFSAIQSKAARVGLLCLAPNLRGKFSALKILAVGLSHMAFVTLSAFPLSSSLLRGFFFSS